MPPPKPPSKPDFVPTLAETRSDSVWAIDEARFGLRIGLRRRWCPRGMRPPWLVDAQDEWLWLYTAVDRSTGRFFFLSLPGVTKDWFALFLTELSNEVGEQRAAVVLDNATSHPAKTPWPAGLTPLPSYSPELNPAEQVFRVLRAKLANQIFATIGDLKAALTAQMQAFWDHPDRLSQLTAYPWWRQGVDAIMLTSP